LFFSENVHHQFKFLARTNALFVKPDQQLTSELDIRLVVERKEDQFNVLWNTKHRENRSE
jgi:hypothetical protein